MNRFAWDAGERRAQAWRAAAQRAELRPRHIGQIARHRPATARGRAVAAGDPLPAVRRTGGTVELVFAGGASVRLDVECIEARLTDTGGAWAASSRPAHRAYTSRHGDPAHQSEPGFEAGSPPSWPRSARFPRKSTTSCARSSRRCGPTATRPSSRIRSRFDQATFAALGIAVSKEDIDRRLWRGRRRGGRGAELRARPHRRASPAADAPPTTATPIRSGVELGSRWTAIEAVGLYVPGGTASYPSSVLMNAVPAKVAGVDRVVITVPAPGGEINPLVLVAADLAGVSRDLPGGRRAGDRRPCLWHRDDPAGRQDRRAGQCLCRGGQAASVRHRRHRHDRRSVGGPGRGRRRQRSGLARRRSAGAGRARRSGPVDPDHRRRRRSATPSRQRWRDS